MLDAELAILSIIAETPTAGRTGRDVEQIIDERHMRFWILIGVESIYYVLDKLEQQGLVISLDDPPPTEKKWRVYRITAAGIGVLQTAVTDLLSNYRYLPARFDIGLVNIPVLHSPKIHHALLSYRDSLYLRQDMLHKQQSQLNSEDTAFYLRSIVAHQLAIVEAEIAWFEEWFPQWQAQAPPVPADVAAEDDIPPAPIPRSEQVILPHDPDSIHKSPTLHHKGGVEYPPPPQKREKPPSSSDKTRRSNPTPPRRFRPSDDYPE